MYHFYIINKCIIVRGSDIYEIGKYLVTSQDFVYFTLNLGRKRSINFTHMLMLSMLKHVYYIFTNICVI